MIGVAANCGSLIRMLAKIEDNGKSNREQPIIKHVSTVSRGATKMCFRLVYYTYVFRILLNSPLK